MTDIQFENILAYYCSPVLLNKKVSNLVSISKKEAGNLSSLAAVYDRKLERYGLKLEIICQCESRMLVFVYKAESLKAHLSSSEAVKMLEACGYPEGAKLNELIDILGERMGGGDFPHEIGLFLGYPIGDVEGFIKNRGQNYKASGYWKVYDDVKSAERLFTLYDNLRSYMLGRIEDGETLEMILSCFEKNLKSA